MKSSKYEQFGPPEMRRVREVVKRTPKDNQVLIRVYTLFRLVLTWQHFFPTIK